MKSLIFFAKLDILNQIYIGGVKMINFKAIGQRIKTQRKIHSLTQEKLAEMLDISTEHLSRIETGSYRPSLVLLEKTSAIFNIGEEELLFGTKNDLEVNKQLLSKIEDLTEDKKQALSLIIDLIK